MHVLWRNEIRPIPTPIQCELIFQETGEEDESTVAAAPSNDGNGKSLCSHFVPITSTFCTHNPPHPPAF